MDYALLRFANRVTLQRDELDEVKSALAHVRSKIKYQTEK
jgi:hypothetical protein